MTTNFTKTARLTSMSPVDAVAADLLRDVAFALRMARRISSEIHSEKAEPRTKALTEAGVLVTLGA
jgi:hypothetical protein